MENVNCPSESEHEQSTEGCIICTRLKSMFTERQVLFKMGLFDELLKISCSSHNALLQCIRKEYDASKSHDINDVNDPGPYNVTFRRTGDPHGEFLVGTNPEDSSRRRWDLLLARSSEEPQTPGYGRILDQEWVDVEIMKNWKNECFIQHREKCHNPLKITQVSPDWLIDTWNKCLVPGNGIIDYLTLSYRWGDSKGFRTERSLLKVLQEPGALSRDSVGADISPSVRHAMHLVQVLDERYLWVDALCIVQDDEEHTAWQLHLMGAIYASSKLTIVAADGDASDGILGLKEISQPRKFDQIVLSLFDHDKVIIRQEPLLRMLTGCSPYFERGWTFQEFFLSQRRLIFAGKQVHWECSCALLHEDLIHDESEWTERDNSHSLLNIMARRPDFDELNALLAEYNCRELEYPEDALAGVTGLLTMIGRSFEGGFLFGLPETCFDSALTWDVKLGCDMERRVPSKRTISVLPGSYLPSWSWIGWKFFAMRVVHEETYKDFYRGRITTPITQWYTHKTPNSRTKRAVRSTWFDFRKKIRESSFILPKEWIKEEYDAAKHKPGKYDIDGPPEEMGKYIYRHADTPDQLFWSPIPIANIKEDTEWHIRAQTRYISCQTKRGWFAAAKFPDTYRSPELWSDSNTIKLKAKKGKWCGSIHLHTEYDMTLFPEAGSDNIMMIELVAICLQRVPIRTYSNAKGQEKRIETCYVDRYAVLWVEWEDGVAYRKALGHIEKKIWDNYDLEDVYLILG